MPNKPTTAKRRIDFFISYTGKDQAWAEWIAWQLEHAGYECVLQAWDFASGGVFPGDMHRALQQSARVIAVLSPAYMESKYCAPEWQAAVAEDPTGEKGILVCVRVADFQPDGLLRGRTYIDLFGLSEEQAHDLLLTRLDHTAKGKRAKPATPPSFPATPAPSFPGSPNPQPKPPSSPQIPHNLPALQPFFGREAELAVIREALLPESRTWGALIDGPGGMGKTSLAVRAAHECTPEQFQRIIFISVKDRELDDDGVRPLGNLLVPGLLAMLNELARELGQPEIPKAPEDQRIRLLLEALRDTRALLILDNLESLPKPERDQLFTFVKRLPPGCKAILTSRRRIGSGSEELILEKLDQDSALATLAELARRNRLLARTSEAERIALYTQTGGKPLLLRWVAGQLGRGSCRSFTDALAFLRACPPENDPLEFIFGDLVEEFTPEETKVLCALTYFRLPVEVEHIAANADLPAEPVVEEALRALANRSLVVPDQEERAYALVPMVAEFLRKWRPEVVKETGQHLEKRAYALIVECGYKNYARFPELEAAWPGIAPALALFLAGENQRLQTVCDALWTFLNFQGHWDEWLALNEKAEAKALAAADHDKAGWRAFHAGCIHHLRQQADPVLACAERAAAHWDRAQAGARERACAIRLRGLGHRLKEDYPAAITAYREALELWRSLAPESVDVATGLNALATAESDSGDFAAAEKHYREALRVARAVGDADCVASFTGNLAELALDRKDWPAAEALAREALPLAEAIHRQELIADDNHRLAEALLRQGKAAEARPHAQRAVEIFTRLGTPELAPAQATLAECDAALGE